MKIMEKRPYRSVKEAVELYGKRILAPELYANVLQQMESEENEDENNLMKIKSVRDELDIAKQNLEKAKERSAAMARSLSSLQEELEDTKRKLQMLKERDSIGGLETVDNSWKSDFKTQSQRFEEEESEVHGKRYAMADAHIGGEVSRNNPSVKKKVKDRMKKSSIFLVKGFFSMKKEKEKQHIF